MNQYQEAYERLELHPVKESTTQTCSALPAVFAYPSNSQPTLEEISEAVNNLEQAFPIDDFKDPSEKDGQFYYNSGRIIREEGEPDIRITADATTLRIFEHPYILQDTDMDNLPRLTRGEFIHIATQLEDSLELSFETVNPDE